MAARAAQIVQTVTATSMVELRRARDAAHDADIVELRLDGVADVDVPGALQGRRLPVIVTCRAAWEGGRWDGGEEARRRLLAEAARAGAEYVDVERRADWQPARTHSRTRLVVSDHDGAGVPADLPSRIRAMRAAGADIVKVAVTATALPDVLVMDERVRAAGPGGNLVAIAMGEAGQLTRLLPARFGSCWTYGGDAAPGQVPVRLLRHRFRSHDVTTATRLYGVAGSPLAHSASPAMHNALFAAAGLDAVYVPVLATTVDDATTVAAALDFAGLSVTAPLKAGWLSRPDVVCDDEETRRLGVVNTVRREGQGWHARNLDIAGFLDGLDAHGVALAGRSALVLGAGGAARAAAWALRTRGAQVSVAARRVERAAEAAGAVHAAVVTWPPAGRWDVVVNATPAGTWSDTSPSPLPAGHIETGVAYDLVYNPAQTRWLREAAAHGAVAIGGLEMLVGQAARQFEWWTGLPADRTVMREAARWFIEEIAGT